MYTIDEQMSLDSATLVVENLKVMKDFYRDNIGLIELDNKGEEIVMGVRNRPLLVLKKRKDKSTSERKAGLFHTAFLLPERRDLGNVLYKLLSARIPLSGASDHGYSEAIYLQDPEDNGIEIYRDKPKEMWTVHEDGRIPGVTEEMDAEGIINSRENDDLLQMPDGTVIGHMHLSVKNLDETEEFYTSLLGLSVKDHLGAQARFLAGGDYHHHIGINTWGGANLSARKEGDSGLQSFTILLSSKDKFVELKAHLNDLNTVYNEKDDTLELVDPNGIIVYIKVE